MRYEYKDSLNITSFKLYILKPCIVSQRSTHDQPHAPGPPPLPSSPPPPPRDPSPPRDSQSKSDHTLALGNSEQIPSHDAYVVDPIKHVQVVEIMDL